jgi:hypothetical protein
MLLKAIQIKHLIGQNKKPPARLRYTRIADINPVMTAQKEAFIKKTIIKLSKQTSRL